MAAASCCGGPGQVWGGAGTNVQYRHTNTVYVLYICLAKFGGEQVDTDPFETGCLPPLNYSGNLGANSVSYRGVDGLVSRTDWRPDFRAGRRHRRLLQGRRLVAGVAVRRPCPQLAAICRNLSVHSSTQMILLRCTERSLQKVGDCV